MVDDMRREESLTATNKASAGPFNRAAGPASDLMSSLIIRCIHNCSRRRFYPL